MSESNCICDYCNRAFHKKPCEIKKSKRNFCSRDCHYNYNQENITHLKHHNIIPPNKLYTLYWVDNLSTRKISKIIGVGRSTVHKYMKRYGIPRRDRIKAIPKRTKFKKNQTLWWIKKGLPNPTTTEKVKEKIRAYRKTQRFPTHHTKPEKKLMELIAKHNLPYKYTGDGSLWIKNINPDFVNCNGKKQVIEVFGDYWHSEKVKSWNQQEFGRIAYYAQLKWNCLIIWEHELVGNNFGNKLSEEEIVEKIEKFT